jgi:predicted enzyme related to lactoylglutathione lyase
MDPVVHFELPADDLGRAQNFYRTVFGWQIQSMPVPGGAEYTIANTTETDDRGMPKRLGAINGGMIKRQAPGERPVIVMDVQSVDDYVKKVQNAGGKIVQPPMNIGTMGRYARITDTEGNVVGLWQTLRKGG